MSSLRGSVLRRILRLRKAMFDWDMSIQRLHATQGWSDWFVGPPCEGGGGEDRSHGRCRPASHNGVRLTFPY